ncbi:MAG: hypothetical protein QOJ92_1358 [Frankiales bacterium]|nr:hypothetical protein [Frankiales bacterium]
MAEAQPEPPAPDVTDASGTQTADSPPPPAKKAPAKKAATKRASSKKAAAKRVAATPVVVPKYPRHSVERALRIPQAIFQQNAGKSASMADAASYLGTGTGASGAFKVEVSSAKKYGFLEADGALLKVSDRARKAIAPQTEMDRVTAFREAILAAPDISDVYNFYRGENLPDQTFFVNALTERFKLPAEKVGEFLDIFMESIKSAELLDTSGDRPRLFDIGRDEAHKPGGGRAIHKAQDAAPAGTTCFIMQPFSAPLGGYYELIFKPAVEQAGLTAVRADAEIFGTGKIIDQIWRGIRNAKVLVAELTTKNANVFYELGLAHALEKPVVLVSSNQDDVPFDLKHIRVILYDQTDPFWGQKLIDKIADNIKSALNNPEEAIFRVEQS